MFNIDMLEQAVNTAQVEYLNLQNKNSIGTKNILLNETLYVINSFVKILHRYKNLKNDTILFDELKSFLSNRWQQIAGFYLSYTNCPNSTATQLCLTVARWLHLYDNSKAIYQYLMPTLTDVVEVLGLYEEDIDELKLSQVILSEDKKSLIPSRLIENLSPTGNITFDKLFKPYVDKAGDPLSKLTDKERQSLIKHSDISYEFYTEYKYILSYQIDSMSLGGEIYRLIKGLRLGGAHSSDGRGSENDAAAVAYEAIARFMAYWDLLEDELKDKIKNLRANSDSHSFQKILDILLKIDTESLDCVEVNADKLELLLNTHSDLYMQGQYSPEEYFGRENLKYLKSLETTLDTAKKQLENSDGYEDLPLNSYADMFSDIDPIKLCNHDLMGLIHDFTGHPSHLINNLCKFGLFTKEMLTSINKTGQTPLTWLLNHHYTESVELLLEKIRELYPYEIANPWAAPLMWSVCYGQFEAVKFIFHEADDTTIFSIKDDRGMTPLILAAYHGHYDIVKFICDNLNLNDYFNLRKRNNRWTDLLDLAYKGDIDIIKRVLEMIDDPDILHAKHPNGDTLLLWAARVGCIDIAEIILKKTKNGDILNARDKENNTPLKLAAKNNYPDIAKLILKRLSDTPMLYDKNIDNVELLYYFLLHGHTDNIKFVLERSPNDLVSSLPISIMK